MKRRIGFVGLGRMGSGICNCFIREGYSVSVFDANPQVLEPFKDKARAAEGILDLLQEDLIFLSLPGSAEVEKIMDAWINHGISGKTFIDLSTSFPVSTQTLFEDVKAAGGRYADASLTGSPAQAQEGALTVMFGGDKEVFDAYRPELEVFAKALYYMGGPGTGNTAKLVNNYLSIMYIVLYAEIFPLAEKVGIDVNYLFEIIGNSGVNCPIYQIAGAKIAKETYDPSFALNLALKDLSYVKKLYDEFQAPTFVLEGGLNMLKTAKWKGLGANDVSEAAKVVRDYLADGGS